LFSIKARGEVTLGLKQYKTLIIVLSIALSLLIVSPTLQQLLVYPQTNPLTEFWLFGPNHDAAYPSNVTTDENIRLYLNVANHLGSTANYRIAVKFANQTQFTPDSFNHTSSTLPSLGSLTVLVAQNATEELPVDVSFQYNIKSDVSSQLNMKGITINGNAIDISSTSIDWDTAKAGFYGDLIFELWIYNGTNNSFQYHERYLDLWLKMNV
jgi:hypothetical protein